jgi:hypothetical protein
MSRIRNTAHYALQCARYGQYGSAIAWANLLPRNTYRAALIVLIQDTYGAYDQRAKFATFETNVRLRQWFARERRLCRNCGKMTDATFSGEYDYCTADCESQWDLSAEWAFESLLFDS